MKRNAFGKERIKNGRCREDTDETCPQKSSRGAPLSLESRSHLWLGLRSDAGRGGGESRLCTRVYAIVAPGRPGELAVPTALPAGQAFPWDAGYVTGEMDTLITKAARRSCPASSHSPSSGVWPVQIGVFLS